MNEIPDIEFMADPYKWPMLVLPVKQRKTGKVGVMFNEKPRVYTVNMYELDSYKDRPQDLPYTDYETLQQLVDDGWVVD